MELFILGTGGEKMRTLLSTGPALDDDLGAIWSIGLLKIAKTLASLVYPLVQAGQITG